MDQSSAVRNGRSRIIVTFGRALTARAIRRLLALRNYANATALLRVVVRYLVIDPSIIIYQYTSGSVRRSLVRLNCGKSMSDCAGPDCAQLHEHLLHARAWKFSCIASRAHRLHFLSPHVTHVRTYEGDDSIADESVSTTVDDLSSSAAKRGNSTEPPSSYTVLRRAHRKR